MCLVNFAEAPATVACDAACMARAVGRTEGYPGGRTSAPGEDKGAAASSLPLAVRLRDLVARRDLPGKVSTVRVDVEAHGSVLYKLTVSNPPT